MIGIVRHGGDGGNVDVDLAHLVLGVEVHLRTMELATLDGFGIPLVIIVIVVLVVISRRRGGKTWRYPWVVGSVGVRILRAVGHSSLDVCETEQAINCRVLEQKIKILGRRKC